jgi:hypothetical protein
MYADVVSLASEFPNDNPALHRGTLWVCHELTGPAEPERAVPWDASELEDAEEATILVEELDPMPIDARIEGAALLTAAAPAAEPAEEEVATVAEADVSTRRTESGIFETAARVEAAPAAVSVDAPGQPEGPVRASAPEAGRPDDEPATVIFDGATALPPAPDDPFTVLVCTLADVAIGAGSPHVAALLPALFFDGRLEGPLDPALAQALTEGGLLDGASVTRAFAETASAWRALLRGTSDDFSACGAAMLDEWASEVLAKLLQAPGRAVALRQELRSRGVAAFGLVEAAA